MSRAYSDYDGENPIGYVWDSIVRRTIRGKKGQQNLRDLEATLLEMKAEGRGRLIREDICRNGDVCVVGALTMSISPSWWIEM